MDVNVTRKKVRGLAKLSFVLGEQNWDYYKFSYKSLKPIADAGDLWFTNKTGRAGYEESYAKTTKYWNETRKEILNPHPGAAGQDGRVDISGAKASRFDTPFLNTTLDPYDHFGIDRGDVGVVAMKYVNGRDAILVFRDTESRGDSINFANWVSSTVLDNRDGMSATMKVNWKKAGLTWTKAMQEKYVKVDLFERMKIANSFWGVSPLRNFTKDLTDKTNGQTIGDASTRATLTYKEASQQGYWPVTKQVIEEVRRELPPGGRILFTGTGQGGGRAQLARMYTQKKYNEQWQTITFAAVGAACFPRDLHRPGMTNLLDDVDPTKYYENVYDYSHYLDPVASTLGPNIGQTCFVGKQGGESIANTTLAHKYCRNVYGHTGSVLFYALNFNGEPLKTEFTSCKYITHSHVGLMHALNYNTDLFQNGSVLGGCTPYIPRRTYCPKPSYFMYGMSAGLFWTVTIVPGVVLVFLCLLGICTCRGERKHLRKVHDERKEANERLREARKKYKELGIEI